MIVELLLLEVSKKGIPERPRLNNLFENAVEENSTIESLDRGVRNVQEEFGGVSLGIIFAEISSNGVANRFEAVCTRYNALGAAACRVLEAGCFEKVLAIEDRVHLPLFSRRKRGNWLVSSSSREFFDSFLLVSDAMTVRKDPRLIQTRCR